MTTMVLKRPAKMMTTKLFEEMYYIDDELIDTVGPPVL